MKYKAFTLSLLLILICFCATTSSELTKTLPSWVNPDDIREVVFRKLLDNSGPKITQEGWVTFLQIDNKHEPSDDLMSRLSHFPLRLKKQSECNITPQGVTEKSTGHPGLLLIVNKIRYQQDNSVIAEGVWFLSGDIAVGSDYTLSYVSGKWTIIKIEEKWMA